jgi:hypothetical protein
MHPTTTIQQPHASFADRGVVFPTTSSFDENEIQTAINKLIFQFRFRSLVLKLIMTDGPISNVAKDRVVIAV